MLVQIIEEVVLIDSTQLDNPSTHVAVVAIKVCQEHSGKFLNLKCQ
jgi:hypothetical protein